MLEAGFQDVMMIIPQGRGETYRRPSIAVRSDGELQNPRAAMTKKDSAATASRKDGLVFSGGLVAWWLLSIWKDRHA